MDIAAGGISAVTNGAAAVQAATIRNDQGKFNDLVRSMTGVATEQIVEAGHLNGDYATGFGNTSAVASDKHAHPEGAAANQAGVHGTTRTIDKTSKLYEESLGLESYMVKIMLSSMRATVTKTTSGDNDFASKMYEDMLYDEYATSMTKNAGFGLADEIYLQLSKQA